jgi:SNF2 family DNA or RNA helicase
LCQIQTASEGLNLQHFQEIYFTSPWWNPALEDQAIARAHRIGQTQKVDVFRFAMKNFGGESKTLDQYCLEVQKKKRAIVQNFGFN